MGREGRGCTQQSAERLTCKRLNIDFCFVFSPFLDGWDHPAARDESKSVRFIIRRRPTDGFLVRTQLLSERESLALGSLPLQQRSHTSRALFTQNWFALHATTNEDRTVREAVRAVTTHALLQTSARAAVVNIRYKQRYRRRQSTMALSQAPPLKTPANGNPDEPQFVEFSFASSRMGCALSRVARTTAV